MAWFPPDIQQWLQTAPELDSYLGREQLEEVVDGWERMGTPTRVVGWSRTGRYPIRMASFGSGHKSFLAWGYPHPDEPLGAQALVWMGNSLLDGTLVLSDWTIHLILCADPEGVERQTWLDGPLTAESFVRGLWRPTHIGLEVDYGFPLDREPFWMEETHQGRCRVPSECGPDHECISTGVYGPLPESLALAQAIEQTHPDVVGLMHGTHSGGDYTFTLLQPDESTLDGLEVLPGEFGLQRHLGIPIDRGRRWRRHSPDLIVERDFDWFVRRLRRHPDYSEEFSYLGCHSAAVFAETDGFYQGRLVQVITPETTQFRHPWFGDVKEADHTEEVQISIEDRQRAGRRRVVRCQTALGWQIASLTATDEDVCVPYQEKVYATNAVLGVQAIYLRKQTMKAAQEIWQELNRQNIEFVAHPFVDEAARSGFRCEGEGWLLPLRSQERFHQPATRAEYACWRWLWPLHTASILGNFHNWLDVQDQNLPEVADALEKLNALQDKMLAQLPEEMLVEGPRSNAMASVMARTLLFLV